MNCKRCGKPISEHEAGPETDACVAVVVMGWEVEESLDAYWFDGDRLFAADHDQYPYNTSSWSPSRQIAIAWQVVEKIAPMTLEDSGDGWSIWRTNLDGFGYYAEGETAMIAICRAALKAVTNADY